VTFATQEPTPQNSSSVQVDEVGDQQLIRRAHPELAIHQSGGRAAAGSAIVVRTVFCRGLASGIPSARCRWAHIFSDPLQRLRLAPTIVAAFVVAIQNLGDGGVP
jgi:hypothetical protein